MKVKKVLMDAIESGSIVRVVYKMGSQPGHAREIMPLKIENNELFAKCLSSETKKTFFIDKLKLLTNEQYSKLSKWDRDFKLLTDYEIFEFQKKRRHKKVRLYTCVLGFAILFLTFFIIRWK